MLLGRRDPNFRTTTTSNGVTASTTPTTNVAATTDTKKTADVSDAFDELFNS